MSPGKKKIDMGDFEDDELIDEPSTDTMLPVPGDIIDMAEIYLDMSAALKDAAVKPTSEDIQKMAVSVFIGRNQQRNTTYHKTAPVPDFRTADKLKTPAPTQAPPTNEGAIDEYRACAKCGKALPPKYKDGKNFPYYSCYTCKGVTYNDGTFHPWPSKN